MLVGTADAASIQRIDEVTQRNGSLVQQAAARTARVCVYDRAAKAYTGGCTYHVAHPGGRSHETYPVNAYEAESRRLARFTGMASMPKTAPENVINPTYPHTLDLRLT